MHTASVTTTQDSTDKNTIFWNRIWIFFSYQEKNQMWFQKDFDSVVINGDQLSTLNPQMWSWLPVATRISRGSGCGVYWHFWPQIFSDFQILSWDLISFFRLSSAMAYKYKLFLFFPSFENIATSGGGWILQGLNQRGNWYDCSPPRFSVMLTLSQSGRGRYIARTYLQPHYGIGVFGNVYLSAWQQEVNIAGTPLP